MSAAYRVGIIEADCLVREGLMQVLCRPPLTIADAWYSLKEAIAAPGRQEDLSIILVSTARLGMLKPEEAISLREKYPGARVALLAEDYNESVAPVAAAARVDGVLLSSCSPRNLLKSLELIALGQAVFPGPSYLYDSRPPAAVEPLKSPRGNFCKLSQREQQVLAGLVTGASNKVIARQLAITDATVKVHVKSILRKTGTGNRTEAALLAHSLAANGI